MKEKKSFHSKLKVLRKKYFLDPDLSNIDEITALFTSAFIGLAEEYGDSPIYPTHTELPQLQEIIESSKLNERMFPDPDEKLETINKYIQGSVKAGHPFMVKNIIPTVSIPYLSAFSAASVLMPNAVTGEDAGQMLNYELAVVSEVSKLAGMDYELSGGVFTFGGTATNLYGLKIALSKVDPESQKKGISQPIVCIESTPSHYCHETAVNWLGIGTDNLIRVDSNLDQSTKMDELETAFRESVEKGKKIACISVLSGTTSNMGMDDIEQVAKLRDKLVNEYSLDYSPHIHSDAVLGWAYLVFLDYDLENNPLKFTQQTSEQIQKINSKLGTLKYADSFGIDFHKLGFMPYNSSVFIVKDREDMKLLRRNKDVMTPLFHNDKAYNPGKYTLETSRSAANVFASWFAMNMFGKEGYRVLLGHALEMGHIYRREINKRMSEGLHIANTEFFGPDVFIRCYPPGVDPVETYKEELANDEVLLKHSEYITDFANWLEEQGIPMESAGIAISRSSAAIYTNTGQPMIALRIYPLSPYIDEEHAVELVNRLVRYKKQYDQQR